MYIEKHTVGKHAWVQAKAIFIKRVYSLTLVSQGTDHNQSTLGS